MRTQVLRGLYAVTPDQADTERLLAQVQAVLAQRPALLQYRNKSADAALRKVQASQLADLCRSAGVPLIVNDDLALAQALGAGVHLGATDGDAAQARSVLGRNAIVGVSCYDDLERARAAEAVGASYVAFGSVYDSPTKPAARRVPLSVIAAACRTLHSPVCAIGGIRRDRAPELIAIGVSLLAVIGDLFDSEDPGRVAGEYRGLFGS